MILIRVVLIRVVLIRVARIILLTRMALVSWIILRVSSLLRVAWIRCRLSRHWHPVLCRIWRVPQVPMAIGLIGRLRVARVSTCGGTGVTRIRRITQVVPGGRTVISTGWIALRWRRWCISVRVRVRVIPVDSLAVHVRDASRLVACTEMPNRYSSIYICAFWSFLRFYAKERNVRATYTNATSTRWQETRDDNGRGRNSNLTSTSIICYSFSTCVGENLVSL